MGDAVTGFEAPVVALAVDDPVAPEVGGHALPLRIAREVGGAAELSILDLVAKPGRELEQVGLRRVHVVVVTARLYQAGLLRQRHREALQRIQNAEMGETAQHAVPGDVDAVRIDRGASAVLAAEIGDLPAMAR